MPPGSVRDLVLVSCNRVARAGTCACVLLALSAAGPSAQHALLVWERKFDGSIVDVATPAGTPCLAVLTTGQLSVWRYNGELVWRRSFRGFSRVFQASTIAVARSCDWAVVLGTPSYRYAWLIRRDGPDEYIGFKGETPLSAAVHPDGSHVAIATGGRSIHFAGAAPFVIRKSVPYLGGGRVEYASADMLAVSAYGAGVLGRDGEVRWVAPGGVCDVSYPREPHWTVSACSPPHGSSTGEVTVRAPDGSERWALTLDSPHAVAAPDGSFAAVLGADVRIVDGAEVVGERRLMIVRPDGHVVRESPLPSGSLLGVTGAGAIVLRDSLSSFAAYSTDGTPLGTVDVAPRPGGARVGGERFSQLLVWHGQTLRVFAVEGRNE